MPHQSDISINVPKFLPSSISEQTQKVNDQLIQMGQNDPKWWKVGAAKYREMYWAGELPFPAPTVLDGKPFHMPSREKGRDIPCRLMLPSESEEPIKGVFMYIHGGGWTLFDEVSVDPYLKNVANSATLAVLSIGYRLAPENPYPAGPEDCIDAAEWLIANAESQFGVGLSFMGGGSAGGHLSLLTTFHLRKAHPNFHLRGLVLDYGIYDLSLLPSARNFDSTLILPLEAISHFITAFIPTSSSQDLRSPSISPFYAELSKLGSLPPALFICGTKDPLLDDSIMMGIKWMMSGHEAVIKIFEGAAHGFTHFGDELDAAVEARNVTAEFLREKIGVRVEV
ncbi:MAG: hypothetical protein M1812_003743 [Candelaria pacifica]|nr:MAG: hypothetical protein M1812_003743 [Candelaria pacifica]